MSNVRYGAMSPSEARLPQPRPALSAKRRRNLAAAVVVVAAHAVVFTVVALSQPPAPRLVDMPPILVQLVEPLIPPPPPPPPPEKPAAVVGGGAPAAPSVIHTPPKPRPVPHEVTAPVVKAPEQALTVGVAPIASPSPGMGQGGAGTGTGTGVGSGDGAGSGGTPPIIIRRASSAEIVGLVSPEARRARRAGRAAVNCVIRLDQRLDECRVVSEEPAGFSFGSSALRAAEFFRYRPPLDAYGRSIGGQRVTITVLFGRQ